MLEAFLRDCTCVDSREESDYSMVKNKIGRGKPFVVFQPIIAYDFFPMYILEQTKARQFSKNKTGEHVYIFPIGAHSFFIKEQLEKNFQDFYLKDEIPSEIESQPFEISFEEAILLRHNKVPHFLNLGPMYKSNVVYMSLSICNTYSVHVFIICDTPESTWELLDEAYSVDIDFFVESHKGFGTHLHLTGLFDSLMKRKEVTSAMPTYILHGLYADRNMPGTFDYIHCEMYKGNSFDICITPWGRESIADAAIADEVKEINEEKQKRYEENVSVFNRFYEEMNGDYPKKETEELISYLSEIMQNDGGISSFKNIEEPSGYLTYNHEPSEQLQCRAELFKYLATRYVCDTNFSNQQEVSTVIRYHVVRAEKQIFYQNSYTYTNSIKSLSCFTEAVYETVRKLSVYPSFAKIVAYSFYNLWEEELLRVAYKKGDIDFANWIIENDFRGYLQTELFRILCRHDLEKAREIAGRLVPQCIAWILADTCCIHTDRYRQKHLDISKEMHLIFQNISHETAYGIKTFLKKYKYEQGECCKSAYEELMNTYFSDELGKY